MATARGEQEAFRRPCLQKKQSQKRTHRQPQQRIRLRMRQSPFVLAGALGSSHGSRAFLRVRGGARRETRGERRGWDISLIPKTRPATADESETRALTESDARENTRDTLHGLLLAPLTVAVRTVPIPRRRRRDLPQFFARQR